MFMPPKSSAVETVADAQVRTVELAHHFVQRTVGFGEDLGYMSGWHHHLLWRKAAAS